MSMSAYFAAICNACCPVICPAFAVIPTNVQNMR